MHISCFFLIPSSSFNHSSFDKTLPNSILSGIKYKKTTTTPNTNHNGSESIKPMGQSP